MIYLVVLYLRDGKPSFEDGETFVAILHEYLLNLVALYQIISAGANDNLHVQLKRKMNELLEGISNLTTELINENQQFESMVQTAGSEVVVLCQLICVG